MSKPSKQELRAALWEASLVDEDDADRCYIEGHGYALEILERYRSRYAAAIADGDRGLALKWIDRGHRVWALLSAESADWLLDAIPGRNENDWQGQSIRQLLLGLGGVQNASVPPTHHEAIDPVALVLPRWLFTRLGEALRALDSGEVHPVVQPQATGRHGKPGSWDEARVRAVEHVEYLLGQEVKPSAALKRVGMATRIAPGTLRKWKAEYPLAQSRFTAARAAGGYKVQLEAGVTFSEGSGNSVDSHALHFYQQAQDEPLAEFGRKYVELYGDRHWQAE